MLTSTPFTPNVELFTAAGKSLGRYRCTSTGNAPHSTKYYTLEGTFGRTLYWQREVDAFRWQVRPLESR